jgi:ABC-2 type transport system permease protein
MRLFALAIRILRQFIRDKRTMALMILAPILILTMLNLVFNGEKYKPGIGLAGIPQEWSERLEFQDAALTEYDSAKQAEADLKEGKLDAYLSMENGTPTVRLEGSDPGISREVAQEIQEAFKQLQPGGQEPGLKISQLHGSPDMGQFDYFGPVLVGFFTFFFVFLIAGVSFLRERTTGTLERLLASPLRRWEIVGGYIAGFGIFTMLQAGIIASFAVYVLNMRMEGSFLYVLLTVLLLSLTALTLGIFLSAFANNELQMIQFIPLAVVPQIFFSGLFNLETISDWLSWIGPLTPLYYAANALRDVMVRGTGFGEIYPDLLVLAGFSIGFALLNVLALKRYRKI